MPWHLPDDLKRFKALTLGKPVLMGSKTALSIGKILPGRLNLVLTRGTKATFPGQHPVSSIDAALDVAGTDELMVIGGGELYSLAMPRATHLHLTWIDTIASGPDTYFPRFDRKKWRETGRESHASDARHEFGFSFVDYERR